MFDPGTFQARLLDAGQDATKVSALWQDVESWHNHCLGQLRGAAKAAGIPDVEPCPRPSVERVRRLAWDAMHGTFDLMDTSILRNRPIQMEDVRAGVAEVEVFGLSVAAIVMSAATYAPLRKADLENVETTTWHPGAELIKASLVGTWFNALVILDRLVPPGQVLIISDPDLKPARRVRLQTKG